MEKVDGRELVSEGAAYLANGEQDWKEEEEECLIG